MGWGRTDSRGIGRGQPATGRMELQRESAGIIRAGTNASLAGRPSDGTRWMEWRGRPVDRSAGRCGMGSERIGAGIGPDQESLGYPLFLRLLEFRRSRGRQHGGSGRSLGAIRPAAGSLRLVSGRTRIGMGRVTAEGQHRLAATGLGASATQNEPDREQESCHGHSLQGGENTVHRSQRD